MPRAAVRTMIASGILIPIRVAMVLPLFGSFLLLQTRTSPYVRIFKHSFKGPTNLWYIENSLTTLGQEDPVSKYNSMLWNSGVEANKELARQYKRKLEYISNILVIKDPANPENEGKVFLFRYGKKIWDKISALINPEYEGDEPQNPYDFWTGMNFRLRIKQVSGYRNYDDSKFDNPTALSTDDAELERIWKSEHSLQAFLAPSEFKTYEALKASLDRVLDLNSSVEKPVEKPERKPVAKTALEEDESPFVGDEDDDELSPDSEALLKRLRNLADED
jgi:hypothetical protein